MSCQRMQTCTTRSRETYNKQERKEEHSRTEYVQQHLHEARQLDEGLQVVLPAEVVEGQVQHLHQRVHALIHGACIAISDASIVSIDN